MQNQIFAAALGIAGPWYIKGVDSDAGQKHLSIHIDFVAGSRFAYPGIEGAHPVHDTQIKRYRHLNFFQHECHLEVRVPRLKLPDGRVALIEPDWAGKLSGFTLLFEALVLMLARQMPFAAVARIVGESWHRVYAICARYVELAVDAADLSDIRAVAIDETSCQRGHDYLTLVAASSLWAASGRWNTESARWSRFRFGRRCAGCCRAARQRKLEPNPFKRIPRSTPYPPLVDRQNAAA